MDLGAIEMDLGAIEMDLRAMQIDLGLASLPTAAAFQPRFQNIVSNIRIPVSIVDPVRPAARCPAGTIGMDVRFGAKADICSAKRHVRFTPKSGHLSVAHARRQRRFQCGYRRMIVISTAASGPKRLPSSASCSAYQCRNVIGFIPHAP